MIQFWCDHFDAIIKIYKSTELWKYLKKKPKKFH